MNIVYFLQRQDGDIKIGTTKDFRYTQRLGQLEALYGDLVLLGCVIGDRKVEASLHARFVKYRRYNTTNLYPTEFFEPCAELLDYIHTQSIDISHPNFQRKRLAISTNRVAELLNVKFSDVKNVNIQQIQRDTGLDYATVRNWLRGWVKYPNQNTLTVWCKYLNCTIGDILVYQPEE